MAKRQKKDLWWYIKKEYGISGLKRKFTKQTGIPLTKAGVERKLGAFVPLCPFLPFIPFIPLKNG